VQLEAEITVKWLGLAPGTFSIWGEMWPSRKDLISSMWRLSGNGNRDTGRRLVYFNQLGQFVLMIPLIKSGLTLKRCARIARVVATIWGHQVSGQRLILILLITIAHSTATMQGRTTAAWACRNMWVVKESDGYSDGTAVGLYGQTCIIGVTVLSLWSS